MSTFQDGPGHKKLTSHIFPMQKKTGMSEKDRDEILRDIQKNMAQTMNSQQRMEIALFGDKADDESGVIKKLNKHDADLRRGKLFGALGLGAVLGFPALREWIRAHWGI